MFDFCSFSSYPRLTLFIINAIHTLVEKRNLGIADTKSRIETQLDKLYKHLFLHFANEERLMMETGYPAYLTHTSEHDLVFAEAKHRFRKWKDTGNSTEMELFALEFIPTWIYNHIFSMDNPASAYIQIYELAMPNHSSTYQTGYCKSCCMHPEKRGHYHNLQTIQYKT